MKQNKKAKICFFVIYIAGKKELLFYIYAVIVKQIFYKRSTNHYCHPSPVTVRTLLHALPFFSPSSFHTISLSPAFTSASAQASARRIPYHCPPLSPSPHANSIVIGPAAINNNNPQGLGLGDSQEPETETGSPRCYLTGHPIRLRENRRRASIKLKCRVYTGSPQVP